MHKMYSNLAKSHAFPLVFRVPSKPRNPQFFPLGFHLKPLLNPNCVYSTAMPLDFVNKPPKSATEIGSTVRIGSITSGYRLRSGFRTRNFSTSHSHGVTEGNFDGKSLPWLGSRKVKESGKRRENAIVGSLWEESARKLDKGAAETAENRSEIGGVLRSTRYFRKGSELPKKSYYTSRNREPRKERDYANGSIIEEEGEREEEFDTPDDPRWDNIKSRFNRFQKPESQRWNRQENWGRKTYREATESTLPKIIGEVVYGVAPVLAALSASRREFYALYVQEGIDLSNNNKKKKDKKGFEKALQMAEKNGITLKEISKHDLNMIVDNRPHQGLVLDASPLEMVKTIELDPISDEDKNTLWVALDEVTDPQNLGAIIRSAYFFGASGVVLCAKNSAPLSGVVSKASAGALELMELRYCKNMMRFLVSSAENGWRVVGGSVCSRAVRLDEVAPGEPTILVLGSEGTGLRPLVERSCTQLVMIPGNIPVVHKNGDFESEKTNIEQSFLAVESLNVSVAAGVLLHHFIGSKS